MLCVLSRTLCIFCKDYSAFHAFFCTLAHVTVCALSTLLFAQYVIKVIIRGAAENRTPVLTESLWAFFRSIESIQPRHSSIN